MKFIKVTGIITLTAALLISGGVYMATNSAREQQQAEKANVTTTPNEAPEKEDWESFNAPLLQVAETPEASKDTSVATAADIAPLTDRINRLQQQMYNQMRVCSSNAQTLRNTLANLEAREDQLEVQRRDVNNQLRGVSSSTPEGEARRRELTEQRNRIESQRDGVRNSITSVRKQFYTLRSDCRRAINETRSQKNQAESQLQRAFNDAMSTRVN